MEFWRDALAQNEFQGKRVETIWSFDQLLAEFAEIGKTRTEDFVTAQTELLENLQETSLYWFERAQSEANLASTLAAKLAAARSIPDAMTEYQEWTGRQFEMIAEDGKQLLTDTQKFMETGTHLLASSLLIKNAGAAR
jgi:hypothetical protein